MNLADAVGFRTPANPVLPLRRSRPIIEHALARKPPRIVGLLRRAIEWDRLLRNGKVATQAELVQREGFTRSRVSQILGLLRLAPAIQEFILALPAESGRPVLSEHALQPLLRISDRQRQLQAFRRLLGCADGHALRAA